MQKDGLAPGIENEEFLRRCVFTAKVYADRRGIGHLSDDFAGYVMESIARGGLEKPEYLYSFLKFQFLHFYAKENGKQNSARREIEMVSCEVLEEVEAPVKGRDEFAENLPRWLTGSSRAAVVLHFKWGFDYEEIAEVLGIKSTYVCGLVQTARERMRK